MNANVINELKSGLSAAYINGSSAANLAYKPAFVSNNPEEGKKVISSVEDELLRCEEFQISVAFITMGGVTPLLQTLKELEEKFYKLSEKRNNSDHEKSVKQKNLKQYMSEQECDELSRLRGILTNSYLFMINSYSTVITLPYKYISILRIKEDYLKFISADSNEFLLVNSADAWRYAENKNYRYDVGRNKKAI